MKEIIERKIEKIKSDIRDDKSENVFFISYLQGRYDQAVEFLDILNNIESESKEK